MIYLKIGKRKYNCDVCCKKYEYKILKKDIYDPFRRYIVKKQLKKCKECYLEHIKYKYDTHYESLLNIDLDGWKELVNKKKEIANIYDLCSELKFRYKNKDIKVYKRRYIYGEDHWLKYLNRYKKQKYIKDQYYGTILYMAKGSYNSEY